MSVSLTEGKSRVFVTDIDSVLLDISTPIEKAIAKLYPQVAGRARGFMHFGEDEEGYGPVGPCHHVGMWDLQIAMGLTKEDMDQVWETTFATPTLPYPGALSFIRKLKKKGFKIVGLTKRGGKRFLEPCMRDTPILELDDLQIADNHQDKGPFVKAMVGVEYFIDDKIGNILSVHEACPEVKCFLVDQPWNASLDIKVPYTRVYSYWEVLKAVA